ncbi:MAG: hypothetical protein M5U01_05160 [Ardenticatenaceae bacterium]|nr:hypothetical protein [Ardenticatenaceae bacterium]
MLKSLAPPLAGSKRATRLLQALAKRVGETLEESLISTEVKEVPDQSPAILTTVVGSDPVPEWLRACPSKSHLRDATMVVVRTQELAGIDVVADGELYRYDLNHPETNGMIDYFVGQMDSVGTRMSRADVLAFRAAHGMAYRAGPAGVLVGPIGPGTLDLPKASQPLLSLARHRTKFTVTSPYMLSKVLLDRHYKERTALAMAIAEVLTRSPPCRPMWFRWTRPL